MFRVALRVSLLESVRFMSQEAGLVVPPFLGRSSLSDYRCHSRARLGTAGAGSRSVWAPELAARSIPTPIINGFRVEPIFDEREILPRSRFGRFAS